MAKVLLKGNEAVVRAAIEAGCKYFFGYPITPQNEIPEYFSKELRNHYTESIKGLTLENRILPKKFISEIYTLTPVIIKTDKGYWRDQISINEFERLLVENLIKKYNQYTGEKIDEDVVSIQ